MVMNSTQHSIKRSRDSLAKVMVCVAPSALVVASSREGDARTSLMIFCTVAAGADALATFRAGRAEVVEGYGDEGD